MFKNVGSNWVVNVLRIAVLMHLTPFVIDRLGDDVNGVWVTIVSITGLLKLLILGVPMAAVRYLSEALAKQEMSAANRALSTCLGMCLLLGAAALVIGLCLFAGFEAGLVARWQDLPAETLDSARVAFLVVVVQIALGFAARLPYGIFDAHHDFVLRNVIMLGELAVRYGLTLVLLSWDASLTLLAVVQVVCMLTEFAIAMLLVRSRYPGLRFSLAAFDRRMIGGVLSFSLFVMLLNLGAQLAFRVDALVISANLPPEHVTYYDIGNKFWEPLMEFLIGIGVVVMPRATQLSVQGRLPELAAVFAQWTKIALSLVLFVALFLVVLGPEFLAWWVGPEYAGTAGPVMQVIMLSAIFFLPARGVALPILMGLGKPKAPALVFLGMAFANLLISLALVRPFGILGVALGTAVPNLLFSGVLLALTFRELDVAPWSFLGYVAKRAALGALAPLAVLVAAKLLGVASLPGLLAAGALSSLVFAATWLLYVFKDDPHVDPLARWRARRAARSGGAVS